MLSERDWLNAERSFCCAIELAPDYATARNWYANYLATQRRFDDAIREAQKAVVLDPLSATWRMGVGHMLFLARRYEEAVETELNALDMDSHFWLAHWVLGMAYEQLGDRPRAAVGLQHADDFSRGNLMVRGLLGRILALCGRIDEARGILKDLTTRNARDAAPAEAVGMVHAGLGDMNSAFDCFDHAAREGSYLLSFLNVSPVFNSLRSHQRFRTLQRLVRLA